MTQEEKELLLKDLCARLPYNVKVKYYSMEYPYGSKPVILTPNLLNDRWENISNVKPYLRPMSSMTEEEKVEWQQVFELELKALETNEECTIANAASSSFEIDFYNKYHFDYRGLIEKGLALEATEGMYKTE